MKKFYHLFIFTILCIVSLSSKGQNTYLYYKNWYLSGQVGTATFYGDMSDAKNRFFTQSPFSKFYYEDRGLAISIQYGKEINAFVSTGLTFNGGKLTASSDVLGLYMTSNYYEYGLHTQVNFLNMILGASSYRPLDIYAKAGLSGVNFRTTTRDILTDTLVGINDPENPGVYSGTNLSGFSMLGHYGLGIRYRVADNVSITFETSSQRVFNDKLDAHISDKRRFEGYGLMTLGATYHFDMSPHTFRSNTRKYNGKSKEKSIKAYNRKKRVVMKTPNSRKAMKKRYDNQTGRTKFSFRKLFRKTKRNFAK